MPEPTAAPAATPTSPAEPMAPGTQPGNPPPAATGPGAPPAGGVTPPAAPPAGADAPEGEPQGQPGALTPEMQEYMQGLEQRAAAGQEAADHQLLLQYVRRDAARLERDLGMTPEQASQVAIERGKYARSTFRRQRALRNQAAAAIQIGQRFQVDPMQLMDLPSPEAMYAMAQDLTGSRGAQAELAAAKAEIEQLKRRLAPPQGYDGGTPSPDGMRATPDNIDALYIQDPKRWESTYRKFLATRQL